MIPSVLELHGVIIRHLGVVVYFVAVSCNIVQVRFGCAMPFK